jgi:hypothetical protein
MTAVDGDRPGAPPRPTNPPDGPPRVPSSFEDPARLTRAARLVQISLARQSLTYADLQAPDVEHVRAA